MSLGASLSVLFAEETYHGGGPYPDVVLEACRALGPGDEWSLGVAIRKVLVPVDYLDWREDVCDLIEQELGPSSRWAV